jgi:hypothetical protein
MVDTHDLLHSSMQRLNASTAAGNGSVGVPSVVGNLRRSSGDDDDSMACSSKGSNKKAKTSKDIEMLSLSIAKHGESLVTVAKMAAIQQEKERAHSSMQQDNDRIRSLQDTRKNLVIRLAADDVGWNANIASIITNEIKKIDNEINDLTLSLNRGRKEETPKKAIAVQSERVTE